ncbi:MAG: TIGR02281 family clan AA aspartic protease [Rhodocyclales bacterium GT-UBC]|nr:MAG: TIGR02281 family clan AA aspartic protease [Rhodocyclales bacterium GT-UBC]
MINNRPWLEHNVTHSDNRYRSLISATCFALAGIGAAFGADCENLYFSESDYRNEVPLKKPTRAFLSIQKAAKNGNPQAQRSLAVSYETAYLVTSCSPLARYWYEKAAAAGDVTAKEWMERDKTLTAMLSGPECSGPACFDGDANENRVAVLYANANKGEHYFAPLTINGHTVEGLIDTGASTIAMSLETAKKLGINASNGKAGMSATAAGNITTTTVTVPQVDVAGVKLRNVKVTVGITGTPLIGMSFLSRVDVSMGTGVLMMKKRQ